MRLLLFLSCCLLAGHEDIAQKDTGGDWYDGRDAWKSLEDFENETVKVLEVGGRLLSGRLADVTETFVLMERNGTHDKVDRYRVHRITSVHASTRARNTLLGMAYGIGSFGGFSIVYTWWGAGDIKWTPLGVLGVIVVGAAGGGLIGLASSSPETSTVIYEPPPIPSDGQGSPPPVKQPQRGRHHVEMMRSRIRHCAGVQGNRHASASSIPQTEGAQEGLPAFDGQTVPRLGRGG